MAKSFESSRDPLSGLNASEREHKSRFSKNEFASQPARTASLKIAQHIESRCCIRNGIALPMAAKRRAFYTTAYENQRVFAKAASPFINHAAGLRNISRRLSPATTLADISQSDPPVEIPQPSLRHLDSIVIRRPPFGLQATAAFQFKSNRARSLSIHVLNPQSFRAFFPGSLCIKAVEVSPFNFVKSALLDSATFNY
jgi:hypothetical protein